MKGPAFIEWLRRPWGVIVYPPIGDFLADAVEIADDAALATVECYSFHDGRSGLWDTGTARSTLTRQRLDRAISYLDRRGLIERKEGEPHMVRFVEGA